MVALKDAISVDVKEKQRESSSVELMVDSKVEQMGTLMVVWLGIV